MDANQDYQPTKEDLLHLREWIRKTPYIVQDYDDYALATVLRGSKGSLQKAKAIMEKFNGLGYRFPRMCSHLDPLNKITQAYLNATYAFPMPRQLADGTTIAIFAARNDPDVDLSNFDVHELPRILMMSTLVVLWEKITGNSNMIFIFDFSGEKLARAKTVTPNFVRVLLSLAENFPGRTKEAHFINVPSLMEPIVNFGKSLVKNKMAERVHFHSTLDSLHKHIPKNYLPAEFGGTEMSLRILNDAWRKTVESYRDKLIEESNKMRKLDPLRPKSEDKELYDSFRLLDID